MDSQFFSINMYVHLEPLHHCHYYCNNVVCFKSGSTNLKLGCVFRETFGCSGSLAFPHEFLISLSILVYKIERDFDRIYLSSWGGYRYLDRSSFSLWTGISSHPFLSFLSLLPISLKFLMYTHTNTKILEENIKTLFVRNICFISWGYIPT